MNLADDLKARGYAEHSSAPLEGILSTPRTIYHGIDPTADSLHVGHLVPLILMRRLSEQGHRTVFLVGGGTGMIGDPRDSGERSLLDMKVIERNKRALRVQLQRLVGKRIEMVDNATWLKEVGLLEFLRDIGKHFTVNELVKRDLIKRRLETPDESISYTEFTYALLQGFDFLTLFKKKGVDVQVGGADQWTNMLSGVELIRRKLGKEAYCFTCPLVTDANGKKFGKSEGNAIWLDAKKTSPFAFYQFWIQLPDQNLATYFKLYTTLALEDITRIMEEHVQNPGAREAQEKLARIITETVHGPRATATAVAASDVLFGGRTLRELTIEDRAVLMAEVPHITVQRNDLIVDALVEGKLAPSKGEARRLIENRGVNINGNQVATPDARIGDQTFEQGLALLRKGKRDVVVLVLK